MLEIDATVLVTFVLVWILVVVLTRVFFKPLQKVMDEREKPARGATECGPSGPGGKRPAAARRRGRRSRRPARRPRKSATGLEVEALEEKTRLLSEVGAAAKAEIEKARADLRGRDRPASKKSFGPRREPLAEKIEERLMTGHEQPPVSSRLGSRPASWSRWRVLPPPVEEAAAEHESGGFGHGREAHQLRHSLRRSLLSSAQAARWRCWPTERAVVRVARRGPRRSGARPRPGWPKPRKGGRAGGGAARLKAAGGRRRRARDGAHPGAGRAGSERIRTLASQEVDGHLKAGVRELKDYTAELAADLAEERIKNRLTAADQAALIDRSIDG